jgi:hypothetical protein
MEQLSLILDDEIALLERLIQDGLAETIKPRQKLAIFKYLNQYIGELMEKLEPYNPDPSGKADFHNR